MPPRFTLKHLVALSILPVVLVNLLPAYTPITPLGQTHITVHLLLELFAIIVSVLVVMVSWNSLNPTLNALIDAESDKQANRILLTGFLLVAMMDLAHVLTFPGMSDDNPTQSTIIFWLYGRLFELIMIAMIASRCTLQISRKQLLLWSLAGGTLLLLVTTKMLPGFPQFYIPGQGVTPLKTSIEYFFGLAYCSLAFYLLKQAPPTQSGNTRMTLLGYAAILIGLGELALSSYMTTADLSNLLGHLYKIASYALIYKATFNFSFHQPYKRLLQSLNTNRDNEAELNVLIQALPVSIARLDSKLRYRYINVAHEQLMGFSQQAIVGKHIDEVLPHEIRQIARPYLQAALLGKDGSFNYSIEKVDNQKGYRHVKVVPEHTSSSAMGGVLMMIIDTTAHEVMQQKVISSMREMTELNAALDAHAIVAFTDRNGIITKVNDKFCQISKYSREELIGRTHKIINSGKHPPTFFKHLWATISSGEVWNGEICNQAKDGSLYWVHTTIVPFVDQDNKPVQYVAIRADITERKLAEERATYLSLHDELTGLGNRRLMYERLDITRAHCGRMQRFGALIVLDLDNFKVVNDTLGHSIGDELLKETAHRLQHSFRANDTVARLGGDEFVVVISDVGANAPAAQATVIQICEKINSKIRQAYALENHLLHITTSMGFVLFQGQEVSVDYLFERADAALYAAKSQGRGLFIHADQV